MFCSEGKMSSSIIQLLRVSSSVYCVFHVVIFLSLFLLSRYSKKKATAVSLCVLVPISVTNLILLHFWGAEGYVSNLAFTLAIPCAAFFLIIAKYRGWRFAFTFCIISIISAEIIIASAVIDHLIGGGVCILMFILRIVAFPVCEYFAIKKYRSAYFALQDDLPHGWAVFTLMSILFFILMFYVSTFPTLVIYRPYDIPTIIAILIIMPLMYFNIFQVLTKHNRIHKMLKERDVLEIRTLALTDRINSIMDGREQIRIERHDMRHKLGAISVMLRKGEHEMAQSLLEQSYENLSEPIYETYCDDATLDAVLCHYIREAKKREIPIKCRIHIDKPITVDSLELSTVIANALENAVIACSHLPKDKRYISIKCVSEPQFIFQLVNPHDNDVYFDEEGFPSSDRAGHGYGTRSIRAFCEKSGSIADFSTKNGIFYFRLVLPK